MNVIGKCPDCAATIWEGHVTHQCLSPIEGDPSGAQRSFDHIVTPEGNIISGAMRTYPELSSLIKWAAPE